MVSRAFPVAEVLAMITEGAIKDAATVAAFGMLRLKGCSDISSAKPPSSP